MYLPGYMRLLRGRTQVPRVLPPPPGEVDERLVILPGEDTDATTAAGRPIGSEYWSVARKLRYMDLHGIQASVVSSANPWLDFVAPAEALAHAADLNDELQALCAEAPGAQGRLFGLGMLPIHAAEGAPGLVRELERVAAMPAMRGIILPAQGLDHPRMEAVWEACERQGLVVFVHPHYGLGGGGGGGEEMGAYGHVLPLALGFPFETSLAVARLILSGYLDKYPGLTLLLAHAGGTLPFLAGRLDSCLAHDPAVAARLEHTPSDYLRRNFYFDGVIYHRAGLEAVRRFLGPAAKDRIVWGTDHPFFPPPSTTTMKVEEKEACLWPSTLKNFEILWAGEEGVVEGWEGIVRGNASALFRIPV